MATHALKQVTAHSLEGSSTGLSYSYTPDECPVCHTSTHPKFAQAVCIGIANKPESKLQILFQCTKDGCQQTFIATYLFDQDNPIGQYKFVKTSPVTPVKTAFSDAISKLSPNFVEIYNHRGNRIAESAGVSYQGFYYQPKASGYTSNSRFFTRSGH
jgi:hypothetical protein